MNTQETWLWFSLQCLGFVVMGAIVCALTRILRFQTQSWPFARPRKAALWSLGAVLVGWLLVSILFFALAPSKENVVAPGLAHTFADWAGTLGWVQGQYNLQIQPSSATFGRFRPWGGMIQWTAEDRGEHRE